MGITWDFDVNEITHKIKMEVGKKRNDFAENCMNNVVALSPVGETGNYRGSHHFSYGPASFAETGSQSLSIAEDDLRAVYIQTNIVYCVRIENGWSKQAPSGVYANAFNSAVASL